nr:hypothetical protein [Streptomyces sp. WM6386]
MRRGSTVAAARGGREVPGGAEPTMGTRSVVVSALRRPVFSDSSRAVRSTPFQSAWVAAYPLSRARTSMSSASTCPCSSRSAWVVVATASQAVAATEQTAIRTEVMSSRTRRRLRSGMPALIRGRR